MYSAFRSKSTVIPHRICDNYSVPSVTRLLNIGLTFTMRTHTLGVEPSQCQRTPQEEAVVDAYLCARVGVLHDPSGQGQLNDLDNEQKSLTKRIHRRPSHCYCLMEE